MKKTRRARKFLIAITGRRSAVTSAQYREALVSGAAVHAGSGLAQMRPGMGFVIDAAGKILFFQIRTVQDDRVFYVRTNAQQILEHAIYNLKGRRLTPIELQREIILQYAETEGQSKLSG